MDPILAALKKVCEEHKVRRKVLLLEDSSLGAAYLERLAREGTSWVNLFIMSPVQYAREIVSGRMDGRKPLPPGIGPALVAMLLAENPDKFDLFSPVSRFHGAASALWRTISDLRMAGVSSGDLDKKQFFADWRCEELKSCLLLYEGFLAKEQLCDDADIVENAVGRAANGADLIMVGRPSTFSGLEERLIGALPEAREIQLFGEGGIGAVFAELEPFRAVSQEAEIREVLRRIGDSEQPLDEWELVLAGRDFDHAVAEDLLEKLKIPYTTTIGTPVEAVPAGKALLGYLRWVESGFEAGILEGMLRGGALSLKAADSEVSGLQTARTLSRFSLYKGLGGYEKLFSAHGAELKQRYEDRRDEGEEVRERAKSALESFGRTRAVLSDIVESARWAESLDGVSLKAAVDACVAFVKKFSPVRSGRDGGALETLAEALNPLSLFGDRKMPVLEAAALIRGALDGVRVGTERARPGHLLLTSLDRSGVEGRSRTALTGLTLSNGYGRQFQDPFLLDAEREEVSQALVVSGRLQVLRKGRIEGRLGLLEGKTVFSCGVFDSEEGRDASPGILFLQLARVALKEPGLDFSSLEERLPAAVELGAPAAWTDGFSAWFKSGINDEERRKAFPWIETSEQSELARDSDEAGCFDGIVPEASGKYDPTQSGEPVSATYMAEMAKCGFFFFLKRVLGLHPKEDEERDPLIWLDARERGIVLHDVYAAFLRSLKGRCTDPKKDRDAAVEQLDKALFEWKEIVPPATEALFEAERLGFIADLEFFLERTAAEWNERTPVGFEVAFGRDDDEDPLSSVKPVEVEFDGKKFLVHGQMDRLDRTGDNRFEVVDYKTGRLSNSAQKQYEKPEANLQPMFYVAAAEKLLQASNPDAVVEAFSLIHATTRGGWRQLPFPASRKEEAARGISTLVGFLASGRFQACQDKKVCERCSYAAVCGDEPWERAKRLFGGAP
ncbi:MAG: hypothetical protein AUJ52_02760 [Elusimicrobia bacterium CG1_02_63_36]|nr:MAG: hypothetical protein AUJ52_02760 [Elusimicrobia bacterium CG1_02_63_36]PIP84914.1 MAG: hypothetical protein COR54_01595 [Elusimicrobia bacterium CG22_combo_CG10-13_8_21_14_all_63_91]PJA13307.1 MAG: hypothetical protein COX66_15220 [Elusimicrobia bacterium CG_4_10_14_0_2_um_filter_63_34]PJB25539.1 MAG: hypothetical protein CO113_08125 [Elusimicrobia bacterium CG_4_9_14_3_um_filter_62_55]